MKVGGKLSLLIPRLPSSILSFETDHPLYSIKTRLWSGVTAAIHANDLDAATEAKTIVEDSQRGTTKLREESGKKWEPKFFKMKDGEFRPNFTLVLSPASFYSFPFRLLTYSVVYRLPRATAEEQLVALRAFIYGDDFEPEFTNKSNDASTSNSTGPLAST